MRKVETVEGKRLAGDILALALERRKLLLLGGAAGLGAWVGNCYLLGSFTDLGKFCSLTWKKGQLIRHSAVEWGGLTFSKSFVVGILDAFIPGIPFK